MNNTANLILTTLEFEMNLILQSSQIVECEEYLKPPCTLNTYLTSIPPFIQH